ncbi:hypothetical protein K458DRAFT_420925 [Lentithecium fluviatile CBS 122367]|uniref:Uncharacterized protein n=1 Tax=Lentithecium fluviatile CBS 122367 TaxID=1168545 RepID=A0A6G1IS05_9PLEO|nr:hypothetical protein K458DRAFT_420925 [Lentithecium fluviatile CBS 122367]
MVFFSSKFSKLTSVTFVTAWFSLSVGNSTRTRTLHSSISLSKGATTNASPETFSASTPEKWSAKFWYQALEFPFRLG